MFRDHNRGEICRKRLYHQHCRMWNLSKLFSSACLWCHKLHYVIGAVVVSLQRSWGDCSCKGGPWRLKGCFSLRSIAVMSPFELKSLFFLRKKEKLFFLIEGCSKFNLQNLSRAWVAVGVEGEPAHRGPAGLSADPVEGVLMHLILAGCLLQCFYDKCESRCCKRFKQIVELFVGNSVYLSGSQQIHYWENHVLCHDDG